MATEILEQPVQTTAATITTAPAPKLGFKDQLLALPGTQMVVYNFNGATTLDGDPINVLQALNGADKHYNSYMVVTDKHVIATGCSHDSDPPNPMEDWDGEGEVVHRGPRRGNAEEHAKFREAFGLHADQLLDNEAIPDYRKAADRIGAMTAKVLAREFFTEIGIKAVLKKYGKNVSKLSMHKLLAKAMRDCNDLDDFTHMCTGIWPRTLMQSQPLETDVCETVWDMLNSHKALGFEQAVHYGEIGNPYAIELDIYEHSGICYSIAGTGYRDRFDTAAASAAWLPDAIGIEEIERRALEGLQLGLVRKHEDVFQVSQDRGTTWRGNYLSWREAAEELAGLQTPAISSAQLQVELNKHAREYCAGVLETYNAYINGECYFTHFCVIDRATGDVVEEEVVGGYLGSPSEALESTVIAVTKRLAVAIPC